MTTTSAGLATMQYRELTAAVHGDLIVPGDPGYDEARAVYDGMIDKHPAAIARCRDVADVIAGVRFAREHDVEIAVRGGGHNAAGLGVADGALVIDLSLLRSTTVSPQDHTVRADAGCTWGDVDHATVAFGMATPSGFLASTGVAGLTLGGGIGYLSRRFGLTVDNLLAADVVLADGTFVTASESSHRDLFWALRGGGGNFGIVTSFTFRCHDIGEHGTIIGGPVLYDIADTPEVMRWYRELLPSLPEELSGWIGLLTIPRPRRSPGSCGAARRAASSGATPGRTTGPPRCSSRSSRSARRCWSACRRCRSACCRARSTPSTRPGCSGTGGRTSSTRSPTPPSTCTSSTARMLPTGHSTMHMYPIDGAASRVPADATAFAYRDGGWAGIIVGVDPDPANAGRHLPVGQGLLAGAASDLGRRRVHQLHDERGPGPDQSLLPRQLRPAHPGQATATTRATPSTSTRTSSPPASPAHRRRPHVPDGTCPHSASGRRVSQPQRRHNS